jgi:glycosidase
MLMTVHVPEWVKDAIFYQVFPDRFARSEKVAKPTNLESWESPPTRRGYKGGDFVGMLEHLDYLTDLGVNAIYFNPIFQSAANHRYHTHDYFRVDPLLGGDRAFKVFLSAAHEHGIRVVLDGVFNHASRGFLQFNHIMENGEKSPYYNWFIVKKLPLRAFDEKRKPNYQCWWNNRELPKLNTGNQQVRQFIYSVAEYWLNQGIDGWRLDVPLEIKTSGFWEEFRDRVKSVNPNAYILAEIWDEAIPWLQGKHFDAVMNYGFNRACYGYFGRDNLDTSVRPGGYKIKAMDARRFGRTVDRLLNIYDWEVTLSQFNLLSSHDEPRFLTMVNGDKQRFKLATLFQMLFPGAPCIYYGDEIGMQGGPDPDCRRAFPWAEEKWDHQLRDEIRRYIALRKDHIALRRGAYATLYANKDGYAFARQHEDEAIIAAMNTGSLPVDIPLNLKNLVPDNVILQDPWSENACTVEDGLLTLSVEPMQVTIMIYQQN